MKRKVCFMLSLILMMSALSTTSFSYANGHMGFSGNTEINSSTVEVSVMILCTGTRGGECTVTFNPRQLSVANVKYNTREGFYFTHSQTESTVTLLFYTDEEQSGLMMPFLLEFFILGGIEGDNVHIGLTNAVITDGYTDTVVDDSSYDGVLKTFVAPVETEPPATTVTEPPPTTAAPETETETETQTDTEAQTTEQVTQSPPTQTETETENITTITEAVTNAVTTDSERTGGEGLKVLPFIIGAAALAGGTTAAVILMKRKQKPEEKV